MFKDILNFTNSLVIKFKDTALSINKKLTEEGYDIDNNNPYSWKYYLNLSGQYHHTDSKVFIKILEIDDERELTPEILDKYNYTKKILFSCGSYYDELIETYSEQRDYIHGCMYPVDINRAIEAKDGTILNYNNNFIEPQENSLLRELESHIKNHIHRWYLREYTLIDKYYIIGYLGTLYSTLPSKVANIRLSKIHTHEVHSYHMEQFFSSKLYLSNEVKSLNHKSRFWLYQNLDYLLKNIGKQSTLKLIGKLFDMNDIGMGELIIKKPDDDILNTGDLNIDPIYNKKNTLITKSINNSYILKDKQILSQDLVNYSELTTYSDELDSDDVNLMNYLTKYSSFETEDNNVKTKLIDLTTKKIVKMYGIDLSNLLFYYWLYLDKYNKYSLNNERVLVDYIEPNTNKIYSISPRGGLLMFIKLLLKINNEEDKPLSKFEFTNILNTDIDNFNSSINHLWNDGYTEKLYPELIKNMPEEPEYLSSPDTVGAYINDIVKYYEYFWVMNSNVENALVSANLKLIFNRLLKREEYILSETPKTIDELLLEEDITYKIYDTFDIYESIKELVSTFLKIPIDVYEESKETLRVYANLFNKLTSYSTHIYNDDTNLDTISTYYNNNAPVYAKNALVTPLDGDIEPIEVKDIEICAVNNTFKDVNYDFTIVNDKSITDEWHDPIDGIMDVNKGEYKHTPVHYVEVLPEFSYDPREHTYVDKFISDGQGEIDPVRDLDDIVINSEYNSLDTTNDLYAHELLKTNKPRIQEFENIHDLIKLAGGITDTHKPDQVYIEVLPDDPISILEYDFPEDVFLISAKGNITLNDKVLEISIGQEYFKEDTYSKELVINNNQTSEVKDKEVEGSVSSTTDTVSPTHTIEII